MFYSVLLSPAPHFFPSTLSLFSNPQHELEASAEPLALPTSDHGVAGSNPAGGEILLEPKRRFIAQSLSCSPFHRLEMTEILLNRRKTLTHPSIPTWIGTASNTYFSTLQVYFYFYMTAQYFDPWPPTSNSLSTGRLLLSSINYQDYQPHLQCSNTHCQDTLSLETLFALHLIG